ncbi:MAG TPA: hypothetical protein VFK01_03550 [Bradyrhizobium sp.]|nr:hypothetical protein [Bradyrhizobium sp.]
MRKLGYVIAALAAITVAVPSIASAETVVIKRDNGWHHGWHHGWHRDWRHAYGFDRDRGFRHRDRVVIRERDRY